MANSEMIMTKERKGRNGDQILFDVPFDLDRLSGKSQWSTVDIKNGATSRQSSGVPQTGKRQRLSAYTVENERGCKQKKKKVAPHQHCGRAELRKSVLVDRPY